MIRSKNGEQMKIFTVMMTALIMASSLYGVASEQKYNEQPHFKEVTTQELQSYYDQKKPMVVVDARSEKNHTSDMLPNALWIPFDASNNEIAQKLPSKQMLIVVYCCNSICQSSQWMAERLESLGYTNVLLYKGGLNDWVQSSKQK